MEDICRCLSLRTFIFGKDRRSREPDVVGVLKVLANLSMHLSELRAVTLINDEYAFLLSECTHNGIVLFRTKSRRHLLDSRDNQCLGRVLKVFHQIVCTVGLVNASCFEAVVFVNCLVIKVASVDKEEHLVNPAVITKQGCQFVTGQGLA